MHNILVKFLVFFFSLCTSGNITSGNTIPNFYKYTQSRVTRTTAYSYGSFCRQSTKYTWFTDSKKLLRLHVLECKHKFNMCNKTPEFHLFCSNQWMNHNTYQVAGSIILMKDKKSVTFKSGQFD